MKSKPALLKSSLTAVAVAALVAGSALPAHAASTTLTWSMGTAKATPLDILITDTRTDGLNAVIEYQLRDGTRNYANASGKGSTRLVTARAINPFVKVRSCPVTCGTWVTVK